MLSQQKFWNKVRRTMGCWIWQGAILQSGYGCHSTDGKLWRAHRLSYILVKGSIPQGLNVLHKCDNPRCVNPSHLFLGNQSDNLFDSIAKGRNGGGENHRYAKLTNGKVKLIRRLTGTLSQRTLAKMFGVHRTTLRSVQRGETWRHVG